MKFLKKQMRNQLLFKAKSQMKIKEQEVMLLKDIPWRMRKNRKNYLELVNLLKDNGIMFKWLMPEGLSFYYKGTRYNINSNFKMEHFIKSNKDLTRTKQKENNMEEQQEGAMILISEDSSNDEEEEEEGSENEEEKEKMLMRLEDQGKDKDSDKELKPRIYKQKNGKQ